MSSDSDQRLKGHLVLLTTPSWGSLRPLSGIASRAVQERPDIIVSFITVGGWDQKITAECDRYTRSTDGPEEKKAMQRRLRLLNIGGEGFDLRQLMSTILKFFPDCYRKLVLRETIRSMSTGDDIPPTISPTAVVTNAYFYQSIRDITGKDVPVWNWFPAGAYLPLYLFGPEKYGGLGDVANNAQHVAESTGRDVEEVTKEMTNLKQGNLVVLPGLPAFYDYEWYPQRDDRYEEMPIRFSDIFKAGTEFMKECDAFIYDTCSAYEPEAIHATRQWLKESGNRQLYTIGPIFPWPNASSTTNDEVPECETPVRAFMDRMLTFYGENSLLYISFGSLWWPENDFVRVYVEILLELEIPFIFAMASRYAELPTELIEKVSGSGFAMISKWCPQETILSHPVTGWFLSHCGHNSILEALSRGIPIIAWPLVFDQPGNAAYISLSLDVAFELIQVRTGIEGLKRLHRGGEPSITRCEAVALEARDVFRKMREEEGDQKKRNAEAVRDKLSRVWKNGGDALEDFKRLLCDAVKD